MTPCQMTAPDLMMVHGNEVFGWRREREETAPSGEGRSLLVLAEAGRREEAYRVGAVARGGCGGKSAIGLAHCCLGPCH